MREIAVAWLLWVLVLGGSGCALGCLVVFTMRAPLARRFVAAGLVFAACFLAFAMNVVGLVPVWLTFPGIFLMPVLVAFGLRRRWSGGNRV